VVTPNSPTGRYYDIDVTAQVAKDYASDGATPFSDFRFQVDGLQFTGASHFYQFYFAGGPFPAYPGYLTLQFKAVVDGSGLKELRTRFEKQVQPA
jgi:hypothetical protein